MPRLNTTGTTASIAGRAGRRLLAFRNLSAGLTCYWGFESTITSDVTATTCGIPLLAGESIVLAGEDINLHKPVYFLTASGSTSVFYTEG